MERFVALAAVAAVASGVLFPFGVSAQAPGLPDAPGKQVVVDNCTACHNIDLITSQRKSPDDWEATVNRMVANGVTLDESQYNQVVAYLGKNFAKNAPSTGTAAATSVAQVPSAKQPSSH
jgi:mono/diheme cytochrome c family protein